MAFWRFGFGTQSSIDSLLANAPSSRSMLNLGGSGAHAGGPGGDAHDNNIAAAAPGAPGSSTVPVSLERLLDEDDLLQECKNGHPKLTEFLSHPNILRRMLEYVSGAAFEENPMDQLGWPQSPSEEDTRLQHKIKYPHLCAEIILCDIHSIMSVLFADLDLFLAPFWKTVLDKSPQETAQQNIQMAHWSRVNSFLLSQRPIELLALIKSQPDFIEKLVLHLQSPPIADLLFRIIQCEEMPESQGIIHWLADRHLMSKLTEKLSPALPPATHMAASEFIRSVISFCSTANTFASNAEFAPRPTPQQQELENGHHTKWGSQQHQPQLPEMRSPIWVSNRLLSQLAEPEVCSRLLSYALDGGPADAPAQEQSEASKDDDEPTQHELSNTPLTSEPASITFPTELPSPDDVHKPTATSSISSLVNCLSIFIDLIRKNNSDFTEQQIFQFMRKHDLLHQHQQHRAGKDEDIPRPPLPQGPSVVDLRPVLELMTDRLSDLHRFLMSPRSAATIQTAAGTVSPLSAERFKICELLAELFHCSNMALVNRTSTSITPEYDEAGYLKGGIESMPNLLAAISAPAQPGPSSDSLSSEAAATGKQGESSSGSPAQEDKELEAAAEKLELDDREERENETASASPEQSTSAASKANLSAVDQHSVGARYRVAFLEQSLVSTAFDLFFQHPWHNFVHAVVYDLTQQVLTISIRTEVDSRLRESVFTKGHLTQRILDAQKENTVQTENNKGRRLGYMGHLSLLAEEIVKVFASSPDLYERVKDKFDQEAWNTYVDTTLKELRDIDLQPLGGGVSMAVNDTISSSASSLSDEDEEYPGRVNRFGQGPGQSSGSKGVQGGGSKLPSQFSQYFSQQMSGDRPPASTDSEEEDVWPQSRTSFAAPGVEPTSGSSVFDDDFGEFESPHGTPGGSGDPFAPKTRANLTSADWNSEFKSSFDETPVSAEDNPFASSDDDDFGDFQATPRITVPSFDSDSSYDFGGPGNGSFDVNTPLDGPDDGSGFFGGLRASSPEQPKTTPRSDGLVEGHTSDGETVVVPPDEIELQAQEQRRKSISSDGETAK